jgi:hypothetical protein
MSGANAGIELDVRGRGRKAVVIATLDGGEEYVLGRGDVTDPKRRAKLVRLLCDKFPQIDGGEAEKRIDELALIGIERPRVDSPAGEPDDGADYLVRDGCTYWRKVNSEGAFDVLLANFSASIVREVRKDDGVEVLIEYEIKALIDGREFTRMVPARAFPAMNWVGEMLGARAIVEPGQGLRERFRTAIQKLSRDSIRSDTIFAHTGWRKIEGHGWCYLHQGGPIGPVGPITEIGVCLPGALVPLRLPWTNDALLNAASVRAVLRLVRELPARIAFPLVGSAFRAALGNASYSLFFVGTTGNYKTELATLLQQFFGVGFDVKHLPASWSSTSNFIEQLGFVAKDAVLVVDEFTPTGSKVDVQRFYREAERVLRAQGNHSARGRLTAEAALKEAKPPRGLYVVTGEDLPPGESLLARCCVVEIDKGEVSSELLTTFQTDAAAGEYARCMAAFVQWLAGRYEAVQQRLRARIAELRSAGQSDSRHRRTASNIAEVTAAVEVFLEFAQSVPGVLGSQEANDLRKACCDALNAVASEQSAGQTGQSPALMFVQLLQSALGSGAAHLRSVDGGVPNVENPAAFGWRREATSLVESDWRASGVCAGWIDGDRVYLDGAASLKAAQSMSDDSNRIPISGRRLGKHLFEKGLLASSDRTSGHFTVRRRINGALRRVLELRLGVFTEAVTAGTAVSNAPPDLVRGDSDRSKVTDLDTVSVSDRSADVAENGPCGAECPNGPIGPVIAEGVGLGGANAQSRDLDASAWADDFEDFEGGTR